MSEYSNYILMALVTVARNVLAEATNVPFHDKRVVAARQVLQNPLEKVNIVKSLVIVSFDTTTYENLTEAQKISGGVTLVASVFNEAMYIF